MGNYYLAVDIGASGGRHILGSYENGKLKLEEIHRFENGLKPVEGQLCWDLDHLSAQIKTGLMKCREQGKIPVSMGIDTWAVDFVLLDKDGRILGNTVGYRDQRTRGMDQKVYEKITEESLYQRTGIQKQIFNTIYQLMAVKEKSPHLLEKAKSFLLLPDYFNFLLTGKAMTEYTNATTTQLVSQETKDWDYELIERLCYPKSLFQPVSMPGRLVGRLTKEMEKEVGFNLDVIQIATHDTASAVLAVPAREEDFLYISSGTWSLMGTETMKADCSIGSFRGNFTNEGGYGGRFRYLKNIMGLWMIQSVRNELNKKFSFSQLCQMAREEQDFPSRVKVNADCFLAPDSMILQIQESCRKEGQPVPETPGQLARVIYQSLAECYGETAREIEALTGKTYPCIYIVGGGSDAEYLNQLTAEKTGKIIFAGPKEATAVGNLAVQMLWAKKFESLWEARKRIYDSFEMKEYHG